MIKYRLRCRCQHEFEGWFPDSKEYKRQKNKGMIQCPMCDSTAVDKAIMAPNVRTSKLKIPAEDYVVMGETAESILLVKTLPRRHERRPRANEIRSSMEPQPRKKQTNC